MPLLAMTEVMVREFLSYVCRCRGTSYILWLICHFKRIFSCLQMIKQYVPINKMIT